MQSSNTPERTTVRFRPDKANASEWQVDKRIFGKFFEMNGKDTYPGIIDDCIANGSFEEWFAKLKKDGANPPWFQRTEVLYRDTPVTPGLAYPWQPAGESAASGVYEQPEGGVHGKKERRRFQRIHVANGEGAVGIMQRVALSDERTLDYMLRCYTRGTGGLKSLNVSLEDKMGTALTVGTIELKAEWTLTWLKLSLNAPSPYRYCDSPFGEYRLSFTAEGEGAFDVDWVSLTAGDAVEGIYNPTSIELIKSYHVTSIRWGGNYANEYNWKHGIGPWIERPVNNNLNWGGLEPNYFGTNEFLRFCQLSGVEPFLNVGFSYDLPPALAAEWVEYVNGDTSTPMGRLRAEHGYPEPWGVKLWQVGNETYGDYQFGYTNSLDYSERIKTYYTVMKAVDPSITIIMAGEDPMYVDYSEIPGQPPIWNKRMFEIAGTDYIDGLDIHQYTRGIRDAGLREDWLKSNEADPVHYNQVLVAYPTQYEQIVSELKELAANYGFKPLVLEIGEWNLEPEVHPDWPIADYETMAHACYVGGMYNTFIRLGDSIKYAYHRDNVVYYRAYPVDMRPINPGNDTQRFYAEPLLRQGTGWHQLPLESEGPTFTMPQTWVRVRRMENIPYIDTSAILSADGDELILFAVNRDLKKAHEVVFECLYEGQITSASLLLQAAETPFIRQTNWYEPNGYGLSETEIVFGPDKKTDLQMPPGTIARLTIKLQN